MEIAEEIFAVAAIAAEKVWLVVHIYLHESQICRNQYFWQQNLRVQAPAELQDGDEADD